MHGPDYQGTATSHVLSCQHCHAGAADNTFQTMAEAHEGMFVDPSAPGESGCTACHEEEAPRSACDLCHTSFVTSTETSLHTTQQGYITAIEDRCGCEFADQGVDDMFGARCAGCHTTCGQCHVSRPKSVGSGFPKPVRYQAHLFASPDQNEQCTACHGTRVGTDYRGEIEGIAPDVHVGYLMNCMDCHTGTELHGDGTAYEHRYEVAGMPRCENCHAEDLPVDTSDCLVCHPNGVGNPPVVVPAAEVNHAHHVDGTSDCTHCHGGITPPVDMPNMQCQVCHSQPYKNCTNCHNLNDDGFDINESVVQFKIAQNPSPYRDEYDIAVVRHTPIDPETYANWGLDLPDYDTKSTWQYASPHNIRRSTPQTTYDPGAGESCLTACHQSPDGSDGVLLREADLYDESGIPLVDYDANIGIVIPESFPDAK